jgi:tetratricopeptide (TPR) repeat protein
MNSSVKKHHEPDEAVPGRLARSAVYRISLIICLLLLSGCAASRPVISDTRLAAVKLNQRAESSFKNGDYEHAFALYKEALKINRSIEDSDGIAINTLNMAAVCRKLGDNSQAHKLLDSIFQSLPPACEPRRLSEAAFLRALLYFDEKNYDNSLEWGQKALLHCQYSGCDNAGRIYNITGRAYLGKGDADRAISSGQEGVRLNRGFKQKTEEANSLRLIADAMIISNEYAGARRFYEEALSLDKELGLSVKVGRDLLGIGVALLGQKDCRVALEYFKRALSVINSGNDQQGAKAVEEMIRRCEK